MRWLKLCGSLLFSTVWMAVLTIGVIIMVPINVAFTAYGSSKQPLDAFLDGMEAILKDVKDL